MRHVCLSVVDVKCPVPSPTPHQCNGAVSTCWSPGLPDTGQLWSGLAFTWIKNKMIQIVLTVVSAVSMVVPTLV